MEKQIIRYNADLTPDYKWDTLPIRLYSLAAKRYNHAVMQVQTLNHNETLFPGTKLRIIFKSTAIYNRVRSGVESRNIIRI